MGEHKVHKVDRVLRKSILPGADSVILFTFNFRYTPVTPVNLVQHINIKYEMTK